MANTNNKRSILRRKQVEGKTGLGRSSIYESIKNGSFPRPIKLGMRSVGWIENEVEDWLAARIEQRDRGCGDD